MSNAKRKNFIHGITTQARVIHALILREMLTRFGDRALGYIWVMVEPLVQVAIFVGIRFAFGLDLVRDVHMVPFLISGIVPYIYFKNTTQKVMLAVHSNRGLLVFPQLKFPDLFYARFLLETGTYAIILLCALWATHLYITPIDVENLSGALLSFLMIGYCGFAIGIVAAAIIPVFPAFQTYINVVLRVLYFVSGVLFSVELFPQEYHAYIAWVPVVHFIEIFRDNLFSGFHAIDTFTDVNYVILFSTILTLLGFVLVKRMKKFVLR